MISIKSRSDTLRRKELLSTDLIVYSAVLFTIIRLYEEEPSV